MNPNDPKSKPKELAPHKPSPKLKRTAAQATQEVIQSLAETGEPPTLDHLAQLHGLGLLTEIFKLGGELVATRHGSPAPQGTNQPVDPRRQVDPRTRIKPR